MEQRVIGDREVSALGFGCWAIGGPFSDADGKPLGWGEVDDDESIAAVRRAMDLGVKFFDTADTYGAGHSERVLGRAVAGRRDEVVIASKWGNLFNEQTKQRVGQDETPEYMRAAIQATLTRLNTDYLDLYQLHCAPTVEKAEALHDSPEILDICDRSGLASINRTALAMGLLGSRSTKRPATGADIRTSAPEWLRFFDNGVPTPEWASRVDSLREILTSGGRTLAQGALAWVWARSDRTIPIPGFRNVAQAEDNAGALEHGPLTPEQMKEIATLQGV